MSTIVRPITSTNHRCDHCEYYRLLTRCWCITYARQLIAEDPLAATLVDADITQLDHLLGLTQQEPNTIALLTADIDVDHAATVDLSDPIIVARIADGDGEAKWVIDGWHRAYRARREGRSTLPAHVLSTDTEATIRVPLLLGGTA